MNLQIPATHTRLLSWTFFLPFPKEEKKRERGGGGNPKYEFEPADKYSVNNYVLIPNFLPTDIQIY